jgi:hypothetical protein
MKYHLKDCLFSTEKGGFFVSISLFSAFSKHRKS